MLLKWDCWQAISNLNLFKKSEMFAIFILVLYYFWIVCMFCFYIYFRINWSKNVCMCCMYCVCAGYLHQIVWNVFLKKLSILLLQFNYCQLELFRTKCFIENFIFDHHHKNYFSFMFFFFFMLLLRFLLCLSFTTKNNIAVRSIKKR